MISRFFHYNSKTYTSIFEADDEADALFRVNSIFRENGREHYIGQPYTLQEVTMTERDCTDAGSLLVRRCPTTEMLAR